MEPRPRTLRTWIGLTRTGLFLTLLFGLAQPYTGAAQTPTIDAPADTFADDLARRLVVAALDDRRGFIEQGGANALLANRLRVGIEVPDQWLWRDRALYRREETAAAEALGTDSLRLTLVGRNRGSPVLGDQTIDASGPVSLDPDQDQPFLGIMGLSLDEVADRTLLDSQAGDMHVLGLRVIDPLSRRGPEAYRYRSGDTLQVEYPEARSLISVEIHPREKRTGSMTGQLWFDEATHELVRLIVQPNGRWDVSSGLRGIARKIPLIGKNARGRVDYLSIDFARSPRGFVLPQRAFVSAELLWFSDVMSMPTLIEWGVDWDQDTVAMVMDALADLPDSAALALVPEPLSAGWDFGLPRHEINPFVRELARVVPNPPPPSGREMLLSGVGSFRFDQVQGLSVAARYPYPVGPRETLTGELRVGTTSYRAIWEAAFRREVRPVWWELSAYSQLQETNRWETVMGLWNSLDALLFGQDDNNYYQAAGATAAVGGHNAPLSWQVGAFYERQENVDRRTDFSLFGDDEPDPDAPPPVVADSGDVYGLRGQAAVQLGDDPQVGLLVFRAAGELAFGDFEYRDLELLLDAVLPAPGPLTVAFRAAAGRALGDLPAQRLYYLGGRKTVRSFPRNSREGDAYALIKAELGSNVPAFRIVGFADIGWAGDFGALFDQEAIVSVGAGVSFLDGIFRIDLAQSVLGGDDFRVLFYTSGLF